MKIYASKRYHYYEDILDDICGKDLWVFIRYNSSTVYARGGYYPQNYWVQVVRKDNDNYIVKMINDNTYGFDTLDDIEPNKLNTFRILDIYEPLELLSTEELIEDKELDE